MNCELVDKLGAATVSSELLVGSFFVQLHSLRHSFLEDLVPSCPDLLVLYVFEPATSLEELVCQARNLMFELIWGLELLEDLSKLAADLPARAHEEHEPELDVAELVEQAHQELHDVAT